MADWMRWEAMDPMLVLQSKQERDRKRSMPSPARRRIEQLFGGDDEMGRKLEIPGQVTAALFQWGDWAKRPNFWADLRITPFCKIIGMAAGRDEPTIRLDPQSQRVHRAVLAMQCEKTKAILYAYYVAGLAWYDRPELFKKIGVGRDTFYRLLRVGSLSAYNAAGVAKTD